MPNYQCSVSQIMTRRQGSRDSGFSYHSRSAQRDKEHDRPLSAPRHGTALCLVECSGAELVYDVPTFEPIVKLRRRCQMWRRRAVGPRSAPQRARTTRQRRATRTLSNLKLRPPPSPNCPHSATTREV